jgi:hypothetical protein
LKLGNSWAWRAPSLIQGLPSVLQIFLVWFIPESPRFLVSKGRDAQALKTLAYYHADGDEDNALVRYEFEEIKAAIEADRAAAEAVGWRTLFSTPGNLRRMRIIIALAFFSQWSGNGLVSYYLNQVFDSIGITNNTIQLLINGILQIWNLFWALLASSLVERAGRRLLFITSATGMFLCFLFQTVCSAQFAIHGTQAAAHAVIAFIFLFYAFYECVSTSFLSFRLVLFQNIKLFFFFAHSLAFTPLIVAYTVEILPFQLRAKGFTVFNFAISLSLIFNQYVNPIALGKLHWKYYVSSLSPFSFFTSPHTFISTKKNQSINHMQIVYVCWLVFEIFFCWMYVIETKNRTLEETAALFDGEDATTHLVGSAAAHAGVVGEVSAAPGTAPMTEVREDSLDEKKDYVA